MNCDRNGEKICDYSIRLNWEGRAKRKGTATPEPGTPGSAPDLGLGMLDFRASASFSTSSPAYSSFGETDPAIASPENPLNGKDARRPALQFSKFKGYVPQNSTPRSDPRPSTSGSAKRKSHQEDDDYLQQGYASDPANGSKAASHSNGGQATKKARTGSGTNSSHTLENQHHDYLSGGSPNSLTSSHSPHMAFQSPPDTHHTTSTGSPSHDDFLTPLRPASLTLNGLSRAPAAASMVHSLNPDSRRLSVNSLLIQEEAHAYEHRGTIRDGGEQSVFYGIDRGIPDRDIPDNDDLHVLDLVTPTLYSGEFGNADDEVLSEFGFGLSSSKVGCYEDGDLQVKIPRSLHPLPPLLHANPMNLMYFHFFIEFTARILVPHDCPANPFKVILPQSKWYQYCSSMSQSNADSGC